MSNKVVTINRFYDLSEPEKIDVILMLTAEQRQKSQQRLHLENNLIIHLKLPRKTTLKVGDILSTEKEEFLLKIEAKPEELLTVTAKNKLQLMRAAYHLGNRHIPLEIKPDYLRLAFDSVLSKMLIQLGLDVKKETCPFYPEMGAYYHH